MSAYTTIIHLSSKKCASLQRNYSKNGLMLKSGKKISLKPPTINKMLKSLHEFNFAME